MPINTLPKHDVKDLGLAAHGRLRIEWAATQMPVLRLIQERFAKEKPLAGVKIAACLHVTTETANLMLAMQAGGADLALCASNPLSTQDDVAAALVSEYGISTFAVKGEDNDTYYRHINAVLSTGPNMTMDDGCDLVSALHRDTTGLIDAVFGGTEETTTGVVRLRSMQENGVLRYPIVAVNEASTKHFFDNRYGTGQSTLDGVIRATNFLIAGSTVVVAGYGWCGRGIAMRARGLGANVVVTEVDPIRALEALMDGYRVMPSVEAAKRADVFITATGDVNVVDRAQLAVMKDGAMLANSGHFNDEINIPALAEMSSGRRMVRDFVEEFRLTDGRRLYLLADGRLVNLSAAEGHPAGVMDMSFANQALSAEFLRQHASELQNQVYVVPTEIDREIARLKLRAMNVEIDELTDEQRKYLASWESGT
ncbi:MAG TPA: adenosylhomocysteinase [Chloroflexota bacterium]|nr:adenosylhomocysteinase [Chloroflexota bacterium]